MSYLKEFDVSFTEKQTINIANDAVTYTFQTLSEEQQAQARANIGAITEMETEETVFLVLEEGTITNGIPMQATGRLRSYYIPTENVITVATNNSSEYDLYGHFYDEDRVYLGNTGGWIKSFAMADIRADEKFSDVHYFRIVARKANDASAITLADAIGVYEVTQKKTGIGADSVLYTSQSITPAQQAQARRNIGASTYYYHTTREEVGKAHGDINTLYIWQLYDALMAEYPKNVQKNPIEVKDKDGNVIFTNYEYVISTKDYSDHDGAYQVKWGYDDIKKPKYLVMSGVDGRERKTVFSTYRFVRDVLRGYNVPQAFKEGVILHVLPVGCLYGFDKSQNLNENSVYIEDNFDTASEKETQAITKWLTDNADADLYISYHNSGAANEIVAILGDSGNNSTDTAKRIALKGVDRVIPFWRDVIRYPLEFKGMSYIDKNTGKAVTGDRETIFSYSANVRNGGTSILYAQDNLGIPSFAIETPSFYKGTYDEWWNNGNPINYEPEPIAAGAEALGNILIETYEQSLSAEVIDDMKEANSKLDQLLQSASFRIVRDSFTPEADTTELSLAIPAGVKMIEIIPQEAPSNPSGGMAICYAYGVQSIGDNQGYKNGMPFRVDYTTGTAYKCSFYAWDTTNGLSVTVDVGLVFKGGTTYNYTAYYWDE